MRMHGLMCYPFKAFWLLTPLGSGIGCMGPPACEEGSVWGKWPLSSFLFNPLIQGCTEDRKSGKFYTAWYCLKMALNSLVWLKLLMGRVLCLSGCCSPLRPPVSSRPLHLGCWTSAPFHVISRLALSARWPTSGPHEAYLPRSGSTSQPKAATSLEPQFLSG